jgi:hypothetical protein
MTDIWDIMSKPEEEIEQKEENFKIKALHDPWDYVNSINANKTLFTEKENSETIEKEYNAWLVNKAFSYHADTVALANYTNSMYHSDNKLQYDFLINTVRPKKRFAKWVKKEKRSDIELVKQVYGYSQKKAEVALSLLSAEQIKEIRRRISKGGLKNETIRK